MQHDTAEETHDRHRMLAGMITRSPVPLVIAVRLLRRRWFRRRNYQVQVQSLTEHGITVQWTGSPEQLHTFCARLGIAESDTLWHSTANNEEETPQKEDWIPFLFF
jgi:hypothetical protein